MNGRPKTASRVAHHSRDFGDSGVQATIVSEALYTSGGELLNAGPWIEVWVHGSSIESINYGGRMTATEARTLAAALLDAAARLEAIDPPEA
jgi:hypothetical protein